MKTKYNNIVKKNMNSVKFMSTVKPVLSGHSKIDKTKILLTNSSLMKVESIAECSTFDQHLAIIGLKKQILVFLLSGCLRQVLL